MLQRYGQSEPQLFAVLDLRDQRFGALLQDGDSLNCSFIGFAADTVAMTTIGTSAVNAFGEEVRPAMYRYSSLSSNCTTGPERGCCSGRR